MSGEASYKDKGWAWVVVLGAFISHFLTCGFEKGYAILYVEIINKYNTSAAMAAGIGGLSAAIRLLFAPISVTLSNRFNEQIVVICGAIMCFGGLLLSAITEEFIGVAIGYGVIFGFGLTLVYTPSLTICTTYFSRRRATAISLSLSGCGFAALSIPYLIVFLIDRYAYDGAMLILAAISLHYSVSGALYRDVPDDTKVIKAKIYRSECTSDTVRLKTGLLDRMRKLILRCIPVDACTNIGRDPWILLFLFSFCFNMMGSGPVTTLLIHHAENLGYRRISTVQLLAIEGVAQIFVRVLTGLVFDHARIKPHRGIIWACTISFSSLIIFLLAFAHSLWVLSVLMCLRGVSLAIYISQQAVIASDMCEHAPESLKQTIGLTQIGKGVGVFLGSWFSGAIRDYTTHYRPAFLFLSLMQFIGSLTAGVAVLNAGHPTSRCGPCCKTRYRAVSSSEYSVNTDHTECGIEENRHDECAPVVGKHDQAGDINLTESRANLSSFSSVKRSGRIITVEDEEPRPPV
ncbi:Monocarboxylate transporter 12 [Clonorchis sinensis]|uniref:Monocarboxylate transporter 12 n=2 Tax=Clonorchis sinensis TaxID=79923 RepID=A0A8T1MIM1_CLOSI|nr:Monocarboxylate transporter 12 [Clonorchis sinensis]